MPSPSEAVPEGRFPRAFEILFLAGIAALPFIAPANIFFGLALICFLAARLRPRLDLQSALLLLYALCSLLSVFFSPQMGRSAPHLREALLYLVFPMAAVCFSKFRERRALLWIFLGQSLVFSVWGCVEYLVRALPDPSYRIHGPVSHYMTYGGILVILAGILLAYASRGPDALLRKVCLGAAALSALPVFLSLTRNAELGLLAILGMLGLARRKWLVLAAAGAVIVFLFLLPGSVGQRFRSTFNPAETTNRDRLAQWKTGALMTLERPVTGMGLGLVRGDYLRFRRPDAVRFYTPHLHSNLFQIAAERGIPALMSYLGFVGATLWIGWRKRGHWRGLATLLAACGIFTAGLFEFNFGSTVMFWFTLAASALHHHHDEGL
jgi:O-antigen ligase